jgi:trigger factor
VAELADALDLGSSEIISWGFESPLSHQFGDVMARDRAAEQHTERNFTVEVKASGDCKRTLSIEIPWQELVDEEARVVAQLRQEVKVPGFRKGKVPAKYIEKSYKDVIRSDAVRNLLPAVYEDALVREGITPIGEPRFENVKTDDGKPVTMDVTVEIRPQPEVSGYKGVKLKAEKRTIDDSAVEETLNSIREQMATLKVVDRPIRDEDYVLVDYGPLLDNGEIDKERLATNYPIDLAKGNLLPEFKEGLIGLGTGGDKEITVSYPEDFPDKENAGKTKKFHVTVKEIKERELPELNDDFAKRMGEKFKTLDDFRGQVRENLIEEEDRRFEHNAQELIIDKLIEQNPFDVPDAMVQNYLASVVEEDRRRRPEVPDEAERVKEIQEHFGDAAVRTIKKYFILEAIKKQENIALEASEVDAKIDELASEQGDRADEVRAYFRHPEHRRSLENDLLDRKVLDFLTKNAEIKVA